MRPAFTIKVFILYFFFILNAKSQTEHFSVEYLIKEDGLSSTEITSMVQDKQGFIWIGTKYGLNRYDGYSVKFYQNIPNDSTSLCGNSILSLLLDKKGNLWIGTEHKGLSIYDRSKDRFINHSYNSTDSFSLSSSYVRTIKEDHGGNIWIGTVSGLNKYLPETNNFKRYLDYHNINLLETGDNGKLWLNLDSYGISEFNTLTQKLKSLDKIYPDLIDKGRNRILSLCWDHHNLWIGKEDGIVSRFTPSLNEVKSYDKDFKANFLKSILCDSKGNIWTGDDEGISLYSKHSDRFSRINPQLDEKILSSDVSCILEDNQNNLWVATFKGRVNLWHKNTAFDHYKSYNYVSLGYLPESVSSVLEDSEGNLWIGYYTSGIELFKKGSNQKIKFTVASGLGEGTVFEIFEDSRKNIWVGTHKGGLQRYDKQSQQFISSDLNNGERNEDLRSICEDKAGNLWMAFHGKGIRKYDYNTKTFQNFKASTYAIGDDWINTVYCDRSGRIWIGSGTGISILDPPQNNFVNYNTTNSNLSHAAVLSILQDSKKRIWVGTEHGLNLFNEKHKTFKTYTTYNGLSNNFISGLLEDSKGFIWIATYRGISKFNYQNNSVKNYFHNSGLRSNEFFRGAYALGRDGKMYFGAKNGLISFHPNTINSNSYKPNVIITDFKLFNKSVPVSDEKDGLLTRQISETKKVVLPYNHNVIGFEFTAISYVNSKHNNYAYMLEGFDEDWNFIGNKREVTYTNLDPGTYLLKVKAANNDGVWNDQPTTLEIIIKPPFWKTPLAKIFYSIIILLALFFWYQFILQKIKIKNKMELDEMKISFFANISHEFRTPLTLIQGPLDYLQCLTERLSTAEREFFEIMQRNVQRLHRLTNQLMDVYELDAGFMKLKVTEGDLAVFVKTVIETFRYTAIKRNIFYHFNINASDGLCYFDEDKVEKILFNLISNAFKYTPDGGNITVDFSLLRNENLIFVPKKLLKQKTNGAAFVKIDVTDNGKGIDESLHKRVFDRFFKIENKEQHEGSTGIGLALAKELANIHYGDILLESMPEQGSKFTLWLPVNHSHFKPEEITCPPLRSQESDLLQITVLEEPTQLNGSASDNLATLPILLVIEDSEDIRKYIRLYFGSEFQIEEAQNGQEGLSSAFDLIPDIIISDVMMPLLSGIEVCALLKKDIRTSHIPVILLTARNEEGYQLQGLREGGADDYITKPFNISILSAKLKNILAHRERLKNKLLADLKSETEEAIPTTSDDPFFKKLIDIIEQNISNSELNIDTLCKELGLSQANLYRKIQGIIGVSPIQLIKDIRLRRSSSFLAKNKYTVGEVASMVGFVDPKYFSKSFKKEFGISPSEYSLMNEVQKKEIEKKKIY